MIVQIVIDVNMVHITNGLISTLMVFILVMQGNVSRSVPEGVIRIINDLTVPEGATSMVNDYECRIDDDCTGKNTYCDINLNLCSQCLNCSNYFRMPKKSIKCPKDVSDCSTCLDGFLEETFFGGETRDICVPIDLNMLPTPAKNISSISYWEDFGIIVLVISICLFFLTWIHYKKKNPNNMSNASQDSEEQPPPSYNSCMKLNSYVTDNVQEFHLFTGEEPPRNEWRHQNAVPFRLLNDSLDNINLGINHLILNENENVEEVDGVAMREIEEPDLHDEETMPSFWTPPPPPPLPSLSEAGQNDSQTYTPPSKRKRLDTQHTDEKSFQDEDEDNMSDKSQDE